MASIVQDDLIYVDGLDVPATVEKPDESGPDILVHLHPIVGDFGVEECEGTDSVLFNFYFVAIISLFDLWIGGNNELERNQEVNQNPNQKWDHHK